MSETGRSPQRVAAGVFLTVCLPAVFAVAVSGGFLALVPLLLLVVPILITGHAPGLEALERIRSKVAFSHRREQLSASPPPDFPTESSRRSGLLLAYSLAGRAPPRVLVYQ